MTGEIFELVDDMNRTAKLAFKENPEISAQLDKNLIERACKTRKRAVEEEDAAETDVETPPPPLVPPPADDLTSEEGSPPCIRGVNPTAKMFSSPRRTSPSG